MVKLTWVQRCAKYRLDIQTIVTILMQIETKAVTMCEAN